MVECSKTTDILNFQVSYTKLTQNPVISRTIPTKALLYNRPKRCIARARLPLSTPSMSDVGCGPVTQTRRTVHRNLVATYLTSKNRFYRMKEEVLSFNPIKKISRTNDFSRSIFFPSEKNEIGTNPYCICTVSVLCLYCIGTVSVLYLVFFRS